MLKHLRPDCWSLRRTTNNNLLEKEYQKISESQVLQKYISSGKILHGDFFYGKRTATGKAKARHGQLVNI